ncbi:MAG: FIST C-terminal domain-containing protein [Burkholderiales bacterium]|nr:FIST C-terminal domain-containing protein [Burkholderiales bacterium]
MARFHVGHASHVDWRVAFSLAAAMVDASRTRQSAGGPLTLGFAYFTDAYAGHAAALLAQLRSRWPGVAWVGGSGIGVAASGVEYFDEPGLVLMLGALPAGRFEVFSGARPLRRIVPFSALVHADPTTPDLAELVSEMADRTASGYLFGGLVSPRNGGWHLADGAWQGGLSGVAFSADVSIVSRVTQGCQPLGPQRRVTRAERNVVVELDDQPALACLLADLGAGDDLQAALPQLRATLVGLSDAGADAASLRGGQFGPDVRVRHLVGLDPARRAIAIADLAEPGMSLAFCSRDMQAARRDLVRICSEIREELETPATVPAEGSSSEAKAASRRIAGAIYVSCSGRGGPHFGGPSAELQIVRHALGDVPLAGFFAAGEIARNQIVGYTGVLTVFHRGA